MKKLLLMSVIVFCISSLTGCYTRIGKLTMISTRNVDSKMDYVLIAKDVKAVAKAKKGDPLESAIDKAVKNYPTGEFMKNVIISVSKNGKKVKVVGDVWGYAEKK